MIKKRLIYLFSFLLVYNLSFPQNVRHLSVKNGLPQSFVSGISEDEEGFIWISTHNGLARYDGNNFEIFQNYVQVTSNYFFLRSSIFRIN